MCRDQMCVQFHQQAVATVSKIFSHAKKRYTAPKLTHYIPHIFPFSVLTKAPKNQRLTRTLMKSEIVR